MMIGQTMTTQQQPIDLYYDSTPNGRKVTIMLEELGVPYRLHWVKIGRGDQFKPKFAAISPNNKIPAIVDPEGPDGAPISIFESGAILKYLALKFGRLYPTQARAQVKVDEWLFWQVGGFGPMLGQNNHFTQYAPERVPYAITRYVDETHRLFRVLDEQLARQSAAGSEHVAGGEYSIADIAIFGWSRAYERYGIDLRERPHFAAWFQRIDQRDPVRRALAIKQEVGETIDIATDRRARELLFNQR
jgi:GSH-dependent disulfide-bond oxidoreductase